MIGLFYGQENCRGAQCRGAGPSLEIGIGIQEGR